MWIMNNNNEIFENAPVGKAVARMAVPTIISMLVVVIYNMADTFFIGQTGDAMQVAAVSISAPVFTILMAFGNLFGIGGSSAIARALGAKKLERAKQISAFCCYASIGIGVFIMIFCLLGMSKILGMIGASENTVDFAREYVTIIAMSGPFIIFSFAFCNILRGEGASRQAMVGNMIGTVTNIVLDPVLILGFGMGVLGAAVATMIGNILACVYYVSFFVRKKSSLSINISNFSIKDGIVFDIVKIGVPASLNNILMSTAQIVLNNALIQYGDTPVAAMGVASKTNMLVVLLQVGLCSGIQPLIGYSYGAKNYKRLNQVVRFTGICAVIMGTILTVVIFFMKRYLITAFINDEAVIEIGIKIVIALQLSGPFLGILFLCINTLQGMGKALPSLVLTFCRQGLIFVPLIFLLDRMLGLDGVIYAQSIADYASIIISGVMFVVALKKIEKR